MHFHHNNLSFLDSHTSTINSLHVLWECPAYSNCRLTFLKKLQELLGDKYIDFDSLEKTSYVLGSELWEDDFSSLLSIVTTLSHSAPHKVHSSLPLCLPNSSFNPWVPTSCITHPMQILFKSYILAKCSIQR